MLFVQSVHVVLSLVLVRPPYAHCAFRLVCLGSFDSVLFKNNTAMWDGGALVFQFTAAYIVNTQFENNTAVNRDGGAIQTLGTQNGLLSSIVLCVGLFHLAFCGFTLCPST